MADENENEDVGDLEQALQAGLLPDATTAETTPGEVTTPVEDQAIGEGQPADTTPDVPATSEQETPATTTLFDRFREAGIDISKYKSEDELIKGAQNAFSLIGRRNEELEQARQRAVAFDNLQQQFQADPLGFIERLQQQAGIQRPAAEPEKPKSTVPEYSPEWQHQFQRVQDPATQEWTWKISGDADQADLPKYIKYMQWKAAQAEKLLHNPGEVLQPVLNEYGQQLLQPLQERLQQMESLLQHQLMQTEERRSNDYLDQNRSWLFVDGDQTKGATPAGKMFHQAFMGIVNTARAQGLAIDEYATADQAVALVQQLMGGVQQQIAPTAAVKPNTPVPAGIIKKPSVPPAPRNGTSNESTQHDNDLEKMLLSDLGIKKPQ